MDVSVTNGEIEDKDRKKRWIQLKGTSGGFNHKNFSWSTKEI